MCGVRDQRAARDARSPLPAHDVGGWWAAHEEMRCAARLYQRYVTDIDRECATLRFSVALVLALTL